MILIVLSLFYDLERIINTIYQVFEKLELKINFTKTETIIWNWNECAAKTRSKEIQGILTAGVA